VGRVYRFFDTANTWTHRIVDRIQHPNYSARFADDDIALFKLESPLKFNRYVIPICLPDQEQLTTDRAIATGWGRTGFGEDVSEALMKVTIEYFDRRVCDESFEDSERLKREQIDWSKMLCAGSTNKSGDTCNVSYF
jgi:Trypsin